MKFFNFMVQDQSKIFYLKIWDKSNISSERNFAMLRESKVINS